jgi:hypothetical protein
MIRLASLFWLALVAVTGFATFKVKYAVQDIEDELNKVRRHTVAEQQEIHILRAEWTSLNQPERLADLNRRLLSLAALAPKQLQRKIEDIPLRPVPEPAEPLIAAAPEPAVPQPAAADVHAPADTVTMVGSGIHPHCQDSANRDSGAAPAVVAPATSKQTPGSLSEGATGGAGAARQPRSLDRLISRLRGR